MARVFFTLFLFIVSALAQQDTPSPALSQKPAESPELTFPRFSRSSKEYLRDSAELPMILTVDFSATGLNGRMRKHIAGKFDYSFHGFNPRSSNANLNLHGPKPSIREAVAVALVAVLPSELVAAGVENRLKMKAIDSSQTDILAAEFVPEEKVVPEMKCHTSGWMEESYFFENLCLGIARVQLQRDDLSIKTFAYDPDGLPLQANVRYLGETNITAYHVDMDFQKAMLPGDPNPFVVPWHVTVTVITDQGKLLIKGEFALKKIRQK